MDFKVGQSFGEPQPSGISIANRLPRLVKDSSAASPLALICVNTNLA